MSFPRFTLRPTLLAVACGAALLHGVVVSARAAENVLAAQHVDADDIIDRRLDEPVWQEATRVELAYETQPGDNLPAAVATTACLARTDDALLVAFDARDPDPSQIRAFLRDRDALFRDDFAGIMLDTFDDQRRSYELFVNPLGVQTNLIKEEASGNEDDAWDGLWTSAALDDRDRSLFLKLSYAWHPGS